MILIGGDVFESRNPSNRSRADIALLLKLFSRNPTVVVAGNHDSTISSSPLTSLKELQPKTLHIVTAPQMLQFSNFSVIAIPWFFSQIAKSEKSEKTIANLLDVMIAKTKPPRYLVAHATLFGCKYGEHRDVVLGKDILWYKEDLSAFELCCFGHIHKAQVIGNVVYPGSPERLSFGERNEDKGFYTYDGKLEFHSLNPRPMYWFRGKQDEVIKRIREVKTTAIVRATIAMDRGEKVKPVKRGKLHSLETIYEYPRIYRIQDTEILSKSPLDVLDKYLDVTKNKRKGSLLEIAKEL